MSQQINLFNPVFRKKKNYLSALTMAQGLGVILAGVLALAFYGKQRVGALERQVAQTQTVLDAREARKAKASVEFAPRVRSKTLELELSKAELDHQALQEVEQILQRGEFGNTRGYSAYFRAFARSRVEGLWLTGVSIVGAGNEIGLQGRMLQANLVPYYIAGLSREPALKGKSFGRLDIGQAAPVPAAAGAPAARVAEAPRYLEFSLQSAAAPQVMRK
ncbi:MAG TPA: MSHA biogenesis protein MshA [Janthinobacterium sp.]|nr:MSHA biogenesis protein MshA [Janthinobacterium sp.]